MERFCYAKLCHSGILGMRWGRRRYQYEDGTLTPEGKRRYGRGGDLRISERFRDKPDIAPKVIRDNSSDYRDYATRKGLSKMSDEDIKKAAERIDLEKTLVDKNVALNKSIGEKATPRYLDKLKEINLASKEISEIVNNVANISNDAVRTVNPILNYKELIPKPITSKSEYKVTDKYDKDGNPTGQDRVQTYTNEQQTRVPFRRGSLVI